MATMSKRTVYSHITKDLKVRGGKACIEASRISVTDIVFLYQRGYTPERIQEEYPQLNLAQVYAALSYYYECKDEIESSMKDEDGFTRELDQTWDQYVSRHGGQPPDEPVAEDRRIARPAGWRPKQ